MNVKTMKKIVIIKKFALTAIALGLYFVSIHAQNTPRGGGAADLAVWSRESFGQPGVFTNPDTRNWIPFVPRKGDVDADGILDVSHYVEKPSGTHGFLRHDNKGNFVFERILLF